VTLLIGVNDAVQRVSIGTYEANVTRILDELLARLRPDRIVTVAIPDYTVTPAGGIVVAHGRAILRLLENAELQVAAATRPGRRRGLVPELRWDPGIVPPAPAG